MINLTVKDANTTAIQLTWLSQSDYKWSYIYLVVARLAGVMVHTNTTPHKAYTFSSLTPGALYDLDVFTVVDVVKSEVQTISIDTSKTRQLFVQARNGSGRQLNFRNVWCDICAQNLLRPRMSQSMEAPPASL